MKVALLAITIFVLLQHANAVLGVDISQLFPTSTF
jgi:hypothetical protein